MAKKTHVWTSLLLVVMQMGLGAYASVKVSPLVTGNVQRGIGEYSSQNVTEAPRAGTMLGEEPILP